MKSIDIIIPVFNEGRELSVSLQTILNAVSSVKSVGFRLVLVNDGSTDETLTVLQEFCRQKPDTSLISFTRNFGKEAAILAGLTHSRADAVVVMDCDLQHPPDLIAKMVGIWEQGVDVVEGCKSSRGSESMIRRFMSCSFYGLFLMLAGADLKNHSDFKLLDRKVIDAYVQLPERKRFFRGLVPWLGFSSATLYFDVPARSHGKSGWSLIRLGRLSIDALTGFTSAPLHLITLLGLICFAVSLVIGGTALYLKFAGQAVSGFTTVILLILLLGSFIMFGLGLIGIYLAQVFEEVKKRPVYIQNPEDTRLKKEE